MTPKIDTSPAVADEIKCTTCYMCACRCGIKVYLKDGTVSYIEGNRDHPVNKGVLCAKGSAGIKQHYSPARLTKPLKRVGERGRGEFEEIEWDEALGLAASWLKDIRATAPEKLAFFTGRDQSQALTGWWATQFGTPNFAAHGGFCSVNMAAAGLYTFGGSFWEFGEPDWQHTKYFMLFGVAEDHASNPLKTNLGKLKKRGVKFVSINPIKTGYSAIADEWVGVRPGTDGLFVASLIHELFKADRIDLDYLVRYTNAPWLVIRDQGAADDGLIARNENGAPLCFDQVSKSLRDANSADVSPAVVGEFKLDDGRTAVPSFQLMAERFLSAEYDPEVVADTCGIKADVIKRIAAELAHYAFEEEVVLDVAWTDWAGRKHDKMIGRPISMHAMRGISAHSNGFHTCRMLHVLQIILGSIDCPGGFRYKPPFPKSIPPHLKPAGKMGEVKPNTPLPGAPLGFTKGPQDLLVDGDGTPLRIDKAYSWDAPLAAHGLMHMVITNAANKDPYPIDLLFMYMSNMSWNSSMNIPGIIEALTRKEKDTGDYSIPKIIYSDAYYSEMVPYADLILPDTTYLERWDCISLLDRPISEPDGVADSIRQPVVELDRDVRPFQDVLLDLGARIGLPGMSNDDGSAKYPGGYSDYIVNHERKPGIGPLGGWRGRQGEQVLRGEPNPGQLDRYIENGCFWFHELDDNQKYFKHANKNYIDWAHDKGLMDTQSQIVFELYSETLQRFRLAARGHGNIVPPREHRARIETYFDPLPFWHTPFEEEMVEAAEYPLHALSQRPMAMYHSWGSQNAWLRQIHTANYLYMSAERGADLGIADDDWVWIKSHHGAVKGQVRLMDNVNIDTVWTWNAIGKRSGTWGLDTDAPEAERGFLLNHIISELLPEQSGGYRFSNSDPITGQAAWYDLRVSVSKAEAEDHPRSLPEFDVLTPPEGVTSLRKPRTKEAI
jgi:sulfite dehydrogenase (quinone) subunit SoeA